MKTSIREDGKPPRVLVFATQNNLLAARISGALSDVGFQVALLTPFSHPSRKVRRITERFVYFGQFPLRSMIRTFDRWLPDFIICVDDVAVRSLQHLHGRMAVSDRGADRRVAHLIERSLGPQASFSSMINKSSLLALAALEGLRCPKTIVRPSGKTFESVPNEMTYPLVVKADHSHGGRCVRMVNKEKDLWSAIWELQAPNTWRGKRLLGAMLGSEALRSLKLPLRRTISLQEYVVGRPGNRAVVCWKGAVLAGISAEVVEVTHERGPASVIRLVDHPEMAEISERLVARLGLSGFVGFDFIVDAANRAWLLEMNPRVTQTCHFSLSDGTDLAGTLYAQLESRAACPRPALGDRDLIALFPNEIVRAPSGNHVLTCQHDVPWEELELVRHVLNQVRRRQWRKRGRKFAERHLSPVVGGLVSIGVLAADAADDLHFDVKAS